MKLLEDNYDHNIHGRLKSGHDAFGNELEAPKGYKLFESDDRIEEGDAYFDIYNGWTFHTQKYYIGHHFYYNGGRWTTWAKKII